MKVVVHGEDGEELLLNKLEVGDFVGELALLDQIPRSATVVTTKPTKFLQIQRIEFLRLMQSDQALCQKVLCHLTSRVRDLTEHLRTVSMFDVYGKMLRCFLQMGKFPESGAHSSITISSPPSQQELANMIGCSRETVSRAFKVLKETGFIQVTHTGLLIDKRAVKKYWSNGTKN